MQWVRIDDPAAATESCYARGAAKGGARFSRLEGAWWGDSTGFLLSTNGGSVGEGKVFEYDPRDQTLKVIYDAPNADSLDNPDNMTVTPRGGGCSSTSRHRESPSRLLVRGDTVLSKSRDHARAPGKQRRFLSARRPMFP